MSRNEARAEISRQLREDGFHYGFDDLVDRFTDALAEAREYDDHYVTIKVPSASEFAAPVALVAAALA